MMDFKLKKITALFLAVVILMPSAACGKKKGEIVPPGGEYNSGGYKPTVPDVSKELKDALKQNPEVVGWLQVPNTTINEPVVQTKDNEYYLRRDWKKNYSYEGCYYLDYESVMFDDGVDLAQNSIIYGHNLGAPMGVKDDPNGVKFAQLLKLNNKVTAEKTPYIYFTTEGATHIFEIFAVLYCEATTSPVPYHYADYSDEQFNELVTDLKARSQYEYKVDVKPGDHIITLSTCTYKYGTYTQNPDQRFIVVGRLVRSGENYHELAEIKENVSPKAPGF